MRHRDQLSNINVVRALALGAMGRRIDPSWWAYLTISRSSQFYTTGITKTVVCAMLSCLLDGAYKITLVANRKEKLKQWRQRVSSLSI